MAPALTEFTFQSGSNEHSQGSTGNADERRAPGDRALGELGKESPVPREAPQSNRD